MLLFTRSICGLFLLVGLAIYAYLCWVAYAADNITAALLIGIAGVISIAAAMSLRSRTFAGFAGAGAAYVLWVAAIILTVNDNATSVGDRDATRVARNAVVEKVNESTARERKRFEDRLDLITKKIAATTDARELAALRIQERADRASLAEINDAALRQTRDEHVVRDATLSVPVRNLIAAGNLVGVKIAPADAPGYIAIMKQVIMELAAMLLIGASLRLWPAGPPRYRPGVQTRSRWWTRSSPPPLGVNSGVDDFTPSKINDLHFSRSQPIENIGSEVVDSGVDDFTPNKIKRLAPLLVRQIEALCVSGEVKPFLEQMQLVAGGTVMPYSDVVFRYRTFYAQRHGGGLDGAVKSSRHFTACLEHLGCTFDVARKVKTVLIPERKGLHVVGGASVMSGRTEGSALQ